MGLRFIAALLLLCSFEGMTTRAQGTSASSSAPSVAEQYLFQQANAERLQRGLVALRWDAALHRAAFAHAQQMAVRQSISHQYAGEPELADRGKTAGAQFSLIAENVAEAATAVLIHAAWMNSPGHRANLLDPNVDAVGISVLQKNGQLYAVQDFERTVDARTLAAQEQTVGQLIVAAGTIAVLPSSDDARKTCALTEGFVGARQPTFVIRYTSGDLTKLPDTLKARIATGEYREAVVGACTAAGSQPFSTYSIAVLLYP
jgi:uncharacterized protein YkwD